MKEFIGKVFNLSENNSNEKINIHRTRGQKNSKVQFVFFFACHQQGRKLTEDLKAQSLHVAQKNSNVKNCSYSVIVSARVGLNRTVVDQ